MTTFTIWVPCEPLEVEVRLAESDALSPLERLVIEAIHAGVTSFADLAAMFGLGDRLMLDVVFDLWHGGLILVDTFAGVVGLTQETADLADGGRLTDLKALPGREEPRTLMQETLTGHVLSSRHSRTGERRRRTIVPPASTPVEADDVRPSDIARAVLDDLRRDRETTPGSGNLRVLSAQIKPTRAANTGRTFWLPVVLRTSIVSPDGDATQDASAEQLRIEVLSESILPYGVREEMARRLSSIAETDPLCAFVEYLRENASEPEAHIPDADELIAILRRAVGELDALDPGLVADRHELLRDRANDAEAQILLGRDASVDIDVAVGNAAQLDAVLEMLDGAERQVVISSPWIRKERLEEMLAAMERALQRGVQIFLLWGIDGERDSSTLTDEVHRLLQRLSGPFPARFFFSQRSAGTHAKLVIQDDRRALITSANVLSGRNQDVLELGFSIARRADTLRSRPIERLLAWARDHYPEYVSSRAMYTFAEDFVDDREALRRDDLGRLTVTQPAEPVWTPDDGFALPARKLWASAWRQYADDLAHAHATMPGRRIRVVSDSQHRLLLNDALETASRRLVIASDQLSDDVVDRRFLRRLEARLAGTGRLSVVLIYQRLRPGPEDLQAELNALRERYPKLHVVQRSSHAKVLVCDDVVTISSFNFLSFEGLYARGAKGGVLYRQRTELGLEAHDARAADAVVATLSRFAGLELPESAVSSAGLVERDALTADPRPTRAAAAEIETLRSILASTPAGSHALAASLAAATRAAQNPGLLLDELQNAELTLDDRRAAIAEALLGNGLSQTDRARWLGLVIDDRIASGDLVGATLLRASEDDDHLQAPDAKVLALAASIDGDSFEHAAEEILSLAEGDAEWASVAALGALRLASGDPDGMLLLELGRAAAGPAWGQVIDTISDFWTSFYRALPRQALSSQESSKAARATVDEEWRRLDAALTAAEAKRMTPSWAAAIHDRVHRPESHFGRLRAVIDARDHGAAIAWWELNGRLSLEDVIDDVAGDDGRLHHANRETYLKLLRAVMQAAKELARTKLVEADEADPVVLERATAIQLLVQLLAPRLDEEAARASRRVAPMLDFSHARLKRLIGLAVP